MDNCTTTNTTTKTTECFDCGFPTWRPRRHAVWCGDVESIRIVPAVVGSSYVPARGA